LCAAPKSGKALKANAAPAPVSNRDTKALRELSFMRVAQGRIPER